jgi:hypothetical protein
MTGGTLQMARAAAEAAAREESVDIRLIPARDAGSADVLAADGYVFATPENLAAISGVMKDFFDRSYYGALGQVNGRSYASLVCAGSDGSNAARQIERIAAVRRLQAIAEALILCTHAQTLEAILAEKRIDAADLGRCSDLGAAMVAPVCCLGCSDGIVGRTARPPRCRKARSRDGPPRQAGGFTRERV